jgi:hypothetical protein
MIWKLHIPNYNHYALSVKAVCCCEVTVFSLLELKPLFGEELQANFYHLGIIEDTSIP